MACGSVLALRYLQEAQHVPTLFTLHVIVTHVIDSPVILDRVVILSSVNITGASLVISSPNITVEGGTNIGDNGLLTLTNTSGVIVGGESLLY